MRVEETTIYQSDRAEVCAFATIELSLVLPAEAFSIGIRNSALLDRCLCRFWGVRALGWPHLLSEDTGRLPPFDSAHESFVGCLTLAKRRSARGLMEWRKRDACRFVRSR